MLYFIYFTVFAKKKGITETHIILDLEPFFLKKTKITLKTLKHFQTLSKFKTTIQKRETFFKQNQRTFFLNKITDSYQKQRNFCDTKTLQENIKNTSN